MEWQTDGELSATDLHDLVNRLQRVDALAAAPPAAVVKVEPSTPAERARMDVSVPEATGAAPSKSEVSGDPSSPAAQPSWS